MPVSSQRMPSTQVMIMPYRMPPLTFLTSRTAVITIPNRARMAPTPTLEKVSPLKCW